MSREKKREKEPTSQSALTIHSLCGLSYVRVETGERREESSERERERERESSLVQSSQVSFGPVSSPKSSLQAADRGRKEAKERKKKPLVTEPKFASSSPSLFLSSLLFGPEKVQSGLSAAVHSPGPSPLQTQFFFFLGHQTVKLGESSHSSLSLGPSEEKKEREESRGHRFLVVVFLFFPS